MSDVTPQNTSLLHAPISEAIQRLLQIKDAVDQATAFLQEIVSPDEFDEPTPAQEALRQALGEVATIGPLAKTVINELEAQTCT